MSTRRAPNPIRRFKDRHGLTYPVLAERLGISEDYARKLGADLVTTMSPAMAVQIETRTSGEVTASAIARWSHDRVRARSEGDAAEARP